MGLFKGLGRGLGRLLPGLSRRGGFIKEHEGYGKDDDAEVTDVDADIDLARGEQRDQVAAGDAAAGQTKPQGQDQPSHAVVGNGGDEGRQPHQVLVAHPDGVGEQLVQTGGWCF